ncbi:hypothetical protein V6N13_111983 [Hibiscus sabdariffa]|uniref:Peptidase C1A papain C-terminal domain-containing protein n=1 Tax=Hibiscus sabdariffa TaxID=183260 RepID=A0ABR2TMP1_9ROSI
MRYAATENSPTTGQLISLTEQEPVDCDEGVDQGCEGGEMEDAFKFITAMMELATNQRRLPMQAASTMTSYEDVPENNEQTLQKAVANQPVSVFIDVGGYAFQL